MVSAAALQFGIVHIVDLVDDFLYHILSVL
jgi:hypothetical protein